MSICASFPNSDPFCAGFPAWKSILFRGEGGLPRALPFPLSEEESGGKPHLNGKFTLDQEVPM